jgi:hypothetical protein
MKRKILAVLCTTVAIGMATASFAKDHELNGFFRVRGIWNNYGLGTNTAFTDKADEAKIWEQRVRMKYTMNLNEYLGFTYFGEFDFDWGDKAFANARNDGGGIQGDTVNLETKNLYMSVKVPETPVSAKLGLQGVGDHWSGYFLLSDVAGILANVKLDAVDITVGTFKLWEGSDLIEDDVDLYAVMLGFKPMGDLKLGLDFFYANDNDFNQQTGNTSAIGIQDSFGGADLYWVGANADYKMGGLGLSGWAMYNGGTLKSGGSSATDDIEVSGFAMDVMGTYTVAGVKFGLEGFYVSGDDDLSDDEIDMPLSTDVWSGSPAVYGAAGPTLPFYKSGLMILLYDPKSANFSSAAMRDAQNGALGLWGVVLQGAYTPPNLKAMYVKGAIGYVNSVEDADDAYGTGGETNLGTEIAARVGYKMAEALDLSFNGAYVMLGDFYDDWTTDKNNAALTTEPEDPWLMYLMAELSF